jgi:hypothetical protein
MEGRIFNDFSLKNLSEKERKAAVFEMTKVLA